MQNSLSDNNLWTRLVNYNLDDPNSTFPFSKRLARDNNWSHAFALGAIDEYKKFIYLCCISKQPLTPSDEVDQVWHLHLTYSRCYWDEFCTNITKHKIHHGPTRGGVQEANKYKNLYGNTKQLYELEFGEQAPLKFWPAEKKRFQAAPHFKRINTNDNWVIPKINISLGQVAVVLLLLTGCTLSIDNASLQENGMQFLRIALIVWLVVFLYRFFKKRARKRKARNKVESGCDSTYYGSTAGSSKNSADQSEVDDSGDSGCSSGCSGCGGCGS